MPTKQLGLAGAFLALGIYSCTAQSKQDIRGFTPGMTAAQFDQKIDQMLDDKYRNLEGVQGTIHWWIRKVLRIRPTNCTPDFTALSSTGKVGCELDGNTFQATFTNHLRPRVIRAVSMTFWSDLPPAALIKKISAQYDLTPLKMPTEKDESAVYGLSWIGAKLPLAEWQLSGDLTLTLGGFQHYELSLVSKSIQAQDSQAQRDGQGKANLSPKF